VLTDEEHKLLFGSTEKLFDMLNVDTEIVTTVCPCLFEERLRTSEVAVLRALLQKPMWGEAAAGLGTAITSLLPNLFGSSATQGSSTRGLELTKLMVEELKRTAGEGSEIELTRIQVNDAVMAAVGKYSKDALEVMIELIKREYATVGVDVTVQPGAPDNAVMRR
jgi:hypothetical protein